MLHADVNDCFLFVYYPSERRAELRAGWITELNISPRISCMNAQKHIGLNVNSCCDPAVKSQSLVASCSDFCLFFVLNIHKNSTTFELCWKALHVDTVFCHNLTNILNTNILRPLLLYFVSYSHCFTRKAFFFLFFFFTDVYLKEVVNMYFPKVNQSVLNPNTISVSSRIKHQVIISAFPSVQHK